jgi:ABC-type transport system involved in multi-copper enzyme maturation permease subunit
MTMTIETAPAYRVTQLRVLRSEWAKLWSLRSTWITLAVAVVSLVAIGIIGSARYVSLIDSGGPLTPTFRHATVVDLSLRGTEFAQLALGVLGVLVTAGEYTTGSIRSTLAAVPRRLPVLWSKAAAYGLVAVVVALAGVFVAFPIVRAMISGTPAALSLSDTGVLRSLLCAGLYLGMIGVVGAALGALLRSVAGGIAVFVGVLMLVPGLFSLLPDSWQDNIGPYLPSNAGEAMYALTHDSTILSPGAGIAVFAGWTVLALGGAAYRLVRSDA